MATALLVVGGGLLAAGQIQEGQITKAQGDFAQKISERNFEINKQNAKIAEQEQKAFDRQAKAEIEASQIEAGRIARQEKITSAQQLAILGKTGGGIAGATLSVLTDTAFQFALDKSLALRSGLVRARELRFQGQVSRAGGDIEISKGRIGLAAGKFAKTVGKKQRTAAFIAAGGTVLATAALVAGPSVPPSLQSQVPGTSGGFVPRL